MPLSTQPRTRPRRKPGASSVSQSLDQTCRASARTEEALVPGGQTWRTGCEGRISVVKRRHGLNRCRYKCDTGMQRWIGLGIIADNLITIGHALAKPRAL